MKIYGTIEKVEEREDGHLIVSGVASSEAVDSDGEIVTADAMRAALPDYMKFGAVREMHGNSAGGTAIGCEVGDDAVTHLEALVVDPVAKEKVRTGVYKGFSIGGRVMKRTKNRIEAIKLVEISLVDRPANPEAVFALAKMEGEDDAKKAEAVEFLKKWEGEEVMDAASAIQALDALTWLLMKESGEPGEPAEQVDALRTAITAIKRFIASEIMEDNRQKAEGAADLEKVGAKYSAQTKQALRAVRAAVGVLMDALAAFDDAEAADSQAERDENDAENDKADQEAEQQEDGETGDDKQEAKPGEGEQQAEGEGKPETKPEDGKKPAPPFPPKKKDEETGDLHKINGLENELAKVTSQRDELSKRVRELEAKAAEKPLRAVPVEKNADIDLEKKKPDTTNPEDPVDAMRKAHQHGRSYHTNTNTRLG